MNAHSLLGKVPVETLFNSQNTVGVKEPASVNVAAPSLPSGTKPVAVKFSYLPAAIDWNQGVSHWGLND